MARNATTMSGPARGISQVLKLNLKKAIEVEIAAEEPIAPKEVEIAEE